MDNGARILDLELKLEKLEKRLFAIALSTNELVEENRRLSNELKENSRLDELTRKLIDEQRKIRQTHNVSNMRFIVFAAIAVALFMVERIDAPQFMDYLLAIGGVTGWLAAGGLAPKE